MRDPRTRIENYEAVVRDDMRFFCCSPFLLPGIGLRYAVLRCLAICDVLCRIARRGVLLSGVLIWRDVVRCGLGRWWW